MSKLLIVNKFQRCFTVLSVNFKNVFFFGLKPATGTILNRDGGPYHKQNSPLIFSANQWTVVYMIGTSVTKELRYTFLVESIFNKITCFYQQVYINCISSWALP